MPTICIEMILRIEYPQYHVDIRDRFASKQKGAMHRNAKIIDRAIRNKDLAHNFSI